MNKPENMRPDTDNAQHQKYNCPTQLPSSSQILCNDYDDGKYMKLVLPQMKKYLLFWRW